MRIAEWLKTTPLWLAAPSLLVAGAVGGAIVSYEPLVFDPSLYDTPQASAAQLKTVDAEKLEKANAKTADVQVDSDDATSAQDGGLADGTWTGYAPCGASNSDGWQPYYVGVTIEVDGGKAVRIIKVFGSSTGNAGDASLDWDASENQSYLDWADTGRGSDAGVTGQINSALAAQSSVGDVDMVSGATYSSAAIYNAYVDAVNKAAKAGGSEARPLVSAAAPASSKRGSKQVATKAKRAKAGKLADGTWTGYAACGPDPAHAWKAYYVGVKVKVKGGKAIGITKVWGSSKGNAGSKKLAWDKAENQTYLSWADAGKNGAKGVTQQVNALLKKGKNVSDVDTVSGATYSSASIYNAYLDALAKSAKAAGAKSTGSTKKKTVAKEGSSEEVSATVPVGTLADGTWTGYATCGPDPDQEWKPYYVGVELTVKGGKVVSINRMFGSSTGDANSKVLNWDETENGVYMDGAEYGVGEQLKSAVAAGKNATSIDTVSGCTYSSKALFDAYCAALKKAAAAAGSSVAEPDAGAPAEGDSAGSGNDADGDANEGETAATAKSYYGFARCESGGGDSWSPYYIFLQLAVEDGSVPQIVKTYGDTEGLVDKDVIYNVAENALYLNWAVDGKFGGTGYRMKSVVKQIQAKLDAGASVKGISTVSGATRSSKSILEAYEMAAANAQAEVGTTPEEAVALAANK